MIAQWDFTSFSRISWDLYDEIYLDVMGFYPAMGMEWVKKIWNLTSGTSMFPGRSSNLRAQFPGVSMVMRGGSFTLWL